MSCKPILFSCVILMTADLIGIPLWPPIHGETAEAILHPRDLQDDIADVKSKEYRAGNDASKRYFLITPNKILPNDSLGLVIILPGGDGSADFHPFVKRVFKNAIPENYLVAQPIAKKWVNNQNIVWPTEKNRVNSMKFTTEEFINAVIDDVSAKHQLDSKRIFTLSWSSSGPAAYAASINSPKVAGSFIAMSVFNPRSLPALDKAKGHAYYLYHSEEDRTCPFRMAQQAVTDLGKQGAKVELKTYQGGHGWHGPIYEDIRTGIEWLEKNGQSK